MEITLGFHLHPCLTVHSCLKDKCTRMSSDERSLVCLATNVLSSVSDKCTSMLVRQMSSYVVVTTYPQFALVG